MTTAQASDGTPSVTVVSPVIGSTVPLGDVDVAMTVDLGGEPSGHLDVSIGYYVTGSADVPAGTCDTICQITVPLHIGDWDHPGSGGFSVTAKLTTASGAQTYGGGTVYFQGPSPLSDLQEVRDGQLFTQSVVDTAGSFRVTSQYPRDDVAELRLVDLATGNVVITGSAPFDGARGVDHDAMFTLDFAALANGLYRLEAKARDTAGYYGSGRYTFVRVNHSEPVAFDLGSDSPPVVGGDGNAVVGGSLKIKGPLLSGSKPDKVKLIVDGAERPVIVIPAAWKPVDWQDPATSWQNVIFTMDGPELTVGTHQASVSLVDTLGRVIGKPASKTITVTDFGAKVSAPTLVVGRASTVGFTADPPATRQFDFCDVALTGPGAAPITVGSWCSTLKVLPNLRTSAAVTPRLAGANTFTFSLHTTDGYGRNIPVPATVYAARRATVSAPAVPYGVRSTAKVVVQDSRSLNTWSAAPTGITVYLQRQAVGTTRWVTLGSAKTWTGGVAAIPFVSATNGAFRAVLASSVPGETIITRPIGAVSSAVVTWRLAPRTAVHRRVATYETLANPYDAGAVATLQVRKAGSTKWSTAKTIGVPTTRITRFGYAFPTAGTWYVRVYRPATKQHAAGLSTTITVKVS